MKENQNAQTFNTYARPMIIRSLFGSLMHTADRLIAALFIGASALVATTLITPLMFLVAGIAMLFISGLGAYVGLLIGRKDEKRASRLSSAVLSLMGGLGLLLALPGLFFSQELSYLLGARGDLLILSAEYLKLFSLSFPFLLLGRGLDVLVLNDGSPGYSFKANIVATVLNLFLNVFAVAILGMGIKGLALATLVSTAFECGAGFYYFLSRETTIKFSKPLFELKAIFRVIYNGISDFAVMIVESVMVYVVNMAFITYLTPGHFEAYAAANIIISMFYSIYLGASMGLQPMLSQMMGEKRFAGLKPLISYSIRKSFAYGLLIYIGLMPFVRWILGLFLNGQAIIEIGVFFYMTIGAATLLSNLPLQLTIFFTAINRPMESALISCVRTLMLIPPVVFIFIKYTGAVGVATGFALADIIMILGLMVFMNRLNISKLKVLE